MPDLQWYYAHDEQQHGPVSSAELKQLATSGRIGPDDFVWREGMDEWAPAGRVKGLFPDHPVPSAEPFPSPDVAAAPNDVHEEPEAESVPALSSIKPRQTKKGAGLAEMLGLVQGILWGVCVLVVLLGGLLLTITIIRTKDTQQEAAAGATYAALFLGAYIVARAGEKLSQLLLARDRPKD